MDKTTGKPAVIEKSRSGNVVVPVPMYFPDSNGLVRPDDLLLKPPYHMLIFSRGHHEVEVQCSHSPTLQFMADYLKRWCRVNHNQTNKVSLLPRAVFKQG